MNDKDSLSSLKRGSATLAGVGWLLAVGLVPAFLAWPSAPPVALPAEFPGAAPADRWLAEAARLEAERQYLPADGAIVRAIAAAGPDRPAAARCFDRRADLWDRWAPPAVMSGSPGREFRIQAGALREGRGVHAGR